MDNRSQSSFSPGDGPPNWQVNLQRKFAPRVVAVTSGRERVGKSSIVVNLGVALSQMGKKVLILDADLTLPNIDNLLGIRSRDTIIDVFMGRRTLAEAMVAGPHGLKVVPAARGGGEIQELSQAQKLFFLDELEAFAKEFDFLLVDTGSGISSNVVYFNVGAQERIVVADQDLASVIDAYTLIKVLSTQYGEKRFKIVFNKISMPPQAQHAYSQLTKVADRFLRGSVSLEYIGYIPYDEALLESASIQKVLVENNPSSPAGVAFIEIARSMLVQEPYTAMDGNMKFFWQSLNRRAADTFSQGESHESQLC